MKKSIIFSALTLAFTGQVIAAPTQKEIIDYVEVISVQGTKPVTNMLALAEQVNSADVSDKLRSVAGANVNKNGGVTGIAQYRGLYGDRVAISIDNAPISGAGPNAMDAPLTYVDGSQLHKVEVYRGIAPVSAAIESLAGFIKAEHVQPDFNEGKGFSPSGLFNASYASANDAASIAVNLAVANEQHKMFVYGSKQEGDDGETATITIPYSYEKKLAGFGYGYQDDKNELSISFVDNEIDNADSRALAMDIISIDGNRVNANYNYRFSNRTDINVKVFGNENDHWMNNYSLRNPMIAPIMTRKAYADGNSLGFAVNLSFELENSELSLGADGIISEHNTVIYSPNNALFKVDNFNQVEDDKYSAFVEYQRELGGLQFELGYRYKHIKANAGEVYHHMAMMNPNINELVLKFNNADRKVSDNNHDLVFRVISEPTDTTTFEVALARKERAPSYQERYLWIPMQTAGGLADGNTYVGDINLDSEKAYQLELGMTYQEDKLTFSPHAFYHSIDDYIQGVSVTDMQVKMISGMMGDDTPLQFTNLDANLYGMDMDVSYQITDELSFTGIVSYVRGKRRDNSDNLYRVSPLNARFAISHQLGNLTTSLEVVGVNKQKHVSKINNETPSAGYGLVNLSARYYLSNGLLIMAGAQNLLDKYYVDHLSGRNQANGDELALGEKIPSLGRDLYLSVKYGF